MVIITEQFHSIIWTGSLKKSKLRNFFTFNQYPDKSKAKMAWVLICPHFVFLTFFWRDFKYHSLSLSLSLTHTLTLPLSLSFSLSHTHKHTWTHTLTLTLTLSLTYSLTLPPLSDSFYSLSLSFTRISVFPLLSSHLSTNSPCLHPPFIFLSSSNISSVLSLLFLFPSSPFSLLPYLPPSPSLPSTLYLTLTVPTSTNTNANHTHI